jgi:hypothetical protein
MIRDRDVWSDREVGALWICPLEETILEFHEDKKDADTLWLILHVLIIVACARIGVGGEGESRNRPETG